MRTKQMWFGDSFATLTGEMAISWLLAEKERKEKCMLLSDHNGSLLRRQPGDWQKIVLLHTTMACLGQLVGLYITREH